jgi:hypothetical protein
MKTQYRLTEGRHDDAIQEMREMSGRWYDYFADCIEQFRDDKRFYNGEQWTSSEIQQYMSRHIQPLVYNLLKVMGRQIVAELKNMQPSITLLPADAMNVNNTQGLKLIQGMLRYIAFGAKAQLAYATALLNMISGGWGVLAINTDYSNPNTFDQDLFITAFQEPQNVIFDPLAQRVDKKDGNFCGSWEIFEVKDFERMYPDAEPVTGMGLIGATRGYTNLIAAKSVVVGKFFKKEKKTKTLLLLTNGQDYKIEVTKNDAEEANQQYIKMMTQMGYSLFDIPSLYEADKRKTQVSSIHCYKMTNSEILEHYDWECDDLPYIYVDCASSFQDGKQVTESFIYHARQPQKTYNYAMTNIVAQVNRARKGGMLMSGLQAAGNEEPFVYPERSTGLYIYTPDSSANGPPEYIPPEQIPAQLFELAQTAEEKVQKIMGLLDANRGEVPNQTSGLAIGRTIMQGNLSLVGLYQKLFDGMHSVGETVLKMIPKIYDTERVVSLLNEKGQQQSVTINQSIAGVGEFYNDVTDGTYRLEITPVANFAIQNQMVSDFIFKLAEVIPGAAPLVADYAASILEHPIAPELTERLQNLVPPPVLAKEKGLPPPPAPPNPQQQMMQAQIAKLMAEVQALKTKTQLQVQEFVQGQKEHAVETQLELNRQQIDQANIVADATATQVKANAEIQKAYLDRGTQHGLQILKGIQEKEAKRVLH